MYLEETDSPLDQKLRGEFFLGMVYLDQKIKDVIHSTQ